MSCIEEPRNMKNRMPIYIAYTHILEVLELIAALNKLPDPLPYILSRYWGRGEQLVKN